MKNFLYIGSLIQLWSLVAAAGITLHDLEMSTQRLDFSIIDFASFVCGTPTFNGGTRCLDSTGTWCFDDFGDKRQPESPEEINVSFDLYTSPTSVDKITLSSDLEKVEGLKDLDGSLPWKIIVHGWMMNGQDERMKAIKDAYFNSMEKVNVMIVDWQDGADNKDYCQSAANTRMVGKQIGMMVRKMEEHLKANVAEKTHIIGFSLGGHTAGNAGMYLRRNPSQFKPSGPCEKVYRITGLDAAGPAFEDVDERLGLDPSDACFVDAIHTDADKLGIRRAIGHDDFYPNGGDDQPGCENLGNQVASRRVAGGIDVGCDHSRSVLYFIESIAMDKIFSAYQCDNFNDFKGGMCLTSSSLQYMGDDWRVQNSIEGRCHFTVTRKEYPFSGKHVKITLAFSESTADCDEIFDNRDDEGHGSVYVTLLGNDGSQSERIEMESGEYLFYTTVLNKVTVLPMNMEVKSAKVCYEKSLGKWDDNWCAAYRIEVTYGGNTKTASTKGDNILTDQEEHTLHF